MDGYWVVLPDIVTVRLIVLIPKRTSAETVSRAIIGTHITFFDANSLPSVESGKVNRVRIGQVEKLVFAWQLHKEALGHFRESIAQSQETGSRHKYKIR
jgi:hypothetical protein